MNDYTPGPYKQTALDQAERERRYRAWGEEPPAAPQLGRETWECEECGEEITALGYYDAFGNEVAAGAGEPLMGCPTHGASANARVRQIPAMNAEVVPGSEGKEWRPWRSKPAAPKEVRASETVRAELARYREAIDAVLEQHQRLVVVLEDEAGRVVTTARDESMHRREKRETLSRAYGACYEAVRSAGSVSGDLGLGPDIAKTMLLLRSLRQAVDECERDG